jgi:hypothetical protein
MTASCKRCTDAAELRYNEQQPAQRSLRTSPRCHHLAGHSSRLHVAQVVLSIVRAGQPVGHVCLVRDGLIDGIAATPLPLSGAGRVRRVSF